MRKSTAQLIDQLIVNLVDDGNHDVYDIRLNTSDEFTVVPYVIYFYYIAFNSQGQPVIKHYFHNEKRPISVEEIPGKIMELAWRVRNSDTTLRQIGEDFQNIEWKHKSYIAIFMDSPYWKTLKRDDNLNRAAVVFNTKKKGRPNHSFFDAGDLDIDMGDDGIAELRSAVYFINHMKKSEFGDDLGYDQYGNAMEQQETYSFDVYFDVSRGPDGPSTVFIIDPDGTNMGPPTPPPP